MTSASQSCATITEHRVVAIIRLEGEEDAVAAARILAGAGIRALEVSLTAPGATGAIARAAFELADEVLVGAGTVRTVAQAVEAVDAGATFLISPGLNEDVARWAHDQDVLYVPGALTPTEVEAASRWSPLVKLFPAGRFGPGYVKDLLAPLPDVALMPTGGIEVESVRSYLNAGASAVALGSSLANPRTVAAPDELAAAAHRAVQLVALSTPMGRRA